MKIHTSFKQGTPEWNQIRAGKVTASEMHRLVSPLGKVRTGDGPRTYLLEKLSERWLGAPLPKDFSTFEMEQGTLIEEYARPAFELWTGLMVKQVGFIESDDGLCGCSPDGLIEGEKAGLEIKSPQIVNHVRYLLDGCVPEDYILQVQGSLYVTGFDRWLFTSFRRRMPPLVVEVKPDPKIQYAIEEALIRFGGELETEWQKLCDLNGGPPPKPEKMTFAHEMTAQQIAEEEAVGVTP
jgi:predicted phage-related endonuclease